MARGFDPRPWRSGTSRSPGPHRRDPDEGPGWRPKDAAWELWNIRALWPEADLEFLARIKRRQDRWLAREREALARLWAGDQDILAPGRSFLAEHPELGSGVILSLHIGGYQWLGEPFVQAGLDLACLLNESASQTFRRPVEQLRQHLGLKGKVEWITVGDRSFVKDLLRVVRDGRPVLVFLDGNGGSQGMAETRDRGMAYRLPGREIKVRTGLARLFCRLGCPVHPVLIPWDDDGNLAWQKEPTQHWTREDDPEVVTRRLFDWAFHEVMQRPDQWQFWAMLRESSACFARSNLEQGEVPESLREDFARSFRICVERVPESARLIMEHEAQVWPGEVLADLTDDRFYPAAGLQDEDLDILRGSNPTLARLCREHGRAWVEFHGLRLCLLGLAKLGG
jgi:hypothetical protein